jgi:hypothetical protein
MPLNWKEINDISLKIESLKAGDRLPALTWMSNNWIISAIELQIVSVLAGDHITILDWLGERHTIDIWSIQSFSSKGLSIL